MFFYETPEFVYVPLVTSNRKLFASSIFMYIIAHPTVSEDRDWRLAQDSDESVTGGW